MSKVKVLSCSEKGESDYSHLDPVVEYLLSMGNESNNDFLWGVNRTGNFCHLKQNIDFDNLLNKCDFPPAIKIDVEKQTIDCFNTYSLIKGGLGTK